jgi:hypothetical protein
MEEGGKGRERERGELKEGGSPEDLTCS